MMNLAVADRAILANKKRYSVKYNTIFNLQN